MTITINSESQSQAEQAMLVLSNMLNDLQVAINLATAAGNSTTALVEQQVSAQSSLAALRSAVYEASPVWTVGPGGSVGGGAYALWLEEQGTDAGKSPVIPDDDTQPPGVLNYSPIGGGESGTIVAAGVSNPYDPSSIGPGPAGF